ncbi:MAG: hypothetical protein DI573_07330 [Microbacterium sp.]|nr:MAG: hypothetical protein DI573_07330 [Microbacterium sp.]
MTEPLRHPRLLLSGAAGCALLASSAVSVMVAVGPERALISHLVEGTVVALAWVALVVVCVFRQRRAGVPLGMAAAWSVSAASGGWALLGWPFAIAGAWVSVTTWAIGVGVSYTLGVLEAARWSTPRVLSVLATASALTMAFAFATLPTITVEQGDARPNPLALPLSPSLSAIGIAATAAVSFAAIATLVLGATSPARRRSTWPVVTAAILGLAGIAAGAVANQWAPLVQSLTVPLLPLAIAVTVWGSMSPGIRTANAKLDGAADPASALTATLTEIRHDLGLAGLAIEIADDVVVRVGETGEHRIPLVHLGRIEGHLIAPPLDEDAAIEVKRVGPSIAAVLASARLIEEVRRSRAELAVAREEERRRVRRDLHDEVGPLLSAVVVQSDVASLALERDPERSRRSIAGVRAAAGGAVVALRRIVRDLHPVAVDALGLVGALEELAARLSGTTSVRVSVTPLPPLPAAVEVALYRIAAEATGNAVRHAAPATVHIDLSVKRAVITLTVSDDGTGFEPDRVTPGVGLESVRQRAAELNGTLSIHSDGAGTDVRADIPLESGGDAA